ncbi:MAG TPA: lipase family protein [Oligoflexus sp.]|uniref:alpha/beta hydrolase family protein n=1 Tax=Oligoflexus sp. TaxID=1971216 RepID=UPI002D805689|nr:lipase family protein [Oligoflexus sp.]HET9238968.1 lipase family protein [Oligoflexus sp.]
MIRIRPVLVCGALASLLACAEGSKVESVQPDRPANFQLVDAPAQSARGDLVESTHVVSLSQDEVAQRLGPILAGFKLQAQNGVHIYRVKYQTQTPATPTAAATPVVASGLMIVPDSKQASYPWIGVQHGTVTSKADAPSVTPAEGIFEASQGFVTVVMDYIGYGSSSKVFHPYLVERAYADAGIDFLKATYKFAELNTIGKGPLFLKGYSEGGYATLALQKEIETNYAGVFPLVATGPSGGPYNLEAIAVELLQRETVHPVNIPFLVLSYTKWLSQNDFNPEAIFALPTANVSALFTGQFNNDYIGTKIPTQNAAMLEPALVADFLSAEPKLNEAAKLRGYLKSQSLTNQGWQPRSTTLFFHCVDDEVVPVSSVKVAKEAFPGPNVVVTTFPSPAEGPKLRHGTCPAIFAPTVAFLDVLKKMSGK